MQGGLKLSDGESLGVCPLVIALADTLPETNVSPENRPLEKEIPIGSHHFLGAMLVLGSVDFFVNC